MTILITQKVIVILLFNSFSLKRVFIVSKSMSYSIGSLFQPFNVLFMSLKVDSTA